jgi:hypothetical protein
VPVERSAQGPVRERRHLAGEVAGPVEALRVRQVLVGRPAHSAPRGPLGHHQARRALPASAAGREADLAEAVSPAVGPSGVEEW